MTSEKESIRRAENRKALTLSRFLDPLPILLGVSVSWIWKKEIDISVMGPVVACGYLLLASITWLASTKKKKLETILNKPHGE